MKINHLNKQDIRHTIVSHAGQDAWPGWAMPVVYHGTLFLLFLVAWAGAGCFAKVRRRFLIGFRGVNRLFGARCFAKVRMRCLIGL